VAGRLARRAGELGLLSSHCYSLTGSSLKTVTAFCEELRSYSSLSSYICLQLDKEELELYGVFQPFPRTEGDLGSRSEHCAAAYCSLLALHRLSVASMKAVLAREGREGGKTESKNFLEFQTISPLCLGLHPHHLHCQSVAQHALALPAQGSQDLPSSAAQ
jgi:hypothetical protein